MTAHKNDAASIEGGTKHRASGHMRAPAEVLATWSIVCAVAVLLSASLSGCASANLESRQDESSSPDRASQTAHVATTAVLSDPCAVALMPHAGEAPEDEAIVRAQEKVRASAPRAPYLERLGWAYIAKARSGFDPGFYTLAGQTARCMEQDEPQSPSALLLHGHVLHALHRFAEAEAIARGLVAARGLAFDYGLLGDALMEQGELASAADAYQRMIDIRPCPEAYSRAAHLRWLKGDLPGAIEMMDLAGGAAGDSESAAWSYVRLALYRLQASDPSGAGRLAEDALALVPGYPPALLARGRILLASGRAADAVASLREACTRSPLPEYQWTLIEALKAAHREPEAREIEAALHARGPFEDPRTYALYLATHRVDPDRALLLARKELEVRRDVLTFDAAAWAAHGAGLEEEAARLMQRALAEGTRDARLFYHAGAIAAARGERGRARDLLARARSMNGTLLPSERSGLDMEMTALTNDETVAAGNSRLPAGTQKRASRRLS